MAKGIALVILTSQLDAFQFSFQVVVQHLLMLNRVCAIDGVYAKLVWYRLLSRLTLHFFYIVVSFCFLAIFTFMIDRR